MIIIFDFNRTLYDPETGGLFDGAIELLSKLSARGDELHLVSKLEPTRSLAFLTKLGIAHFFKTTAFVTDKSDALRRLIETAPAPVYVVGDYLHGEIRIGNKHGAKTIWLKHGMFSSLMPEMQDDVPWRTVRNMKEIGEVLSEGT